MNTMMPGPRAKGATTAVAVFKICKHSALIGTAAWSVIIEATSRFIKASSLRVVVGIAAVVLEEDRMPGREAWIDRIPTPPSTVVKTSPHMGMQDKEASGASSACGVPNSVMTLPNTQPIPSQTTTTPASQARRTAATLAKEALSSVALAPRVSLVNMLTTGTTGPVRGQQATSQTTSLTATVATSTTTSTTNSSKVRVSAPTAPTSHLNSFVQMTKQVPDKTEEGVNLAQASDLQSLTGTLKNSASPPNGKLKKRFGSRIHSVDSCNSNKRSSYQINQITCSDAV